MEFFKKKFFYENILPEHNLNLLKIFFLDLSKLSSFLKINSFKLSSLSRLFRLSYSFCLIFFSVFLFPKSLLAEPKEDILYFLTSINSYCPGKDIRNLNGNKCDIRYSPSEHAIKKVIDALPRLGDNDFVVLEGLRYSKEKIYSFISPAIAEKSRHYEELLKMLGDNSGKFMGNESVQKEDGEDFLKKVNNYKKSKSSSTNIFDMLPSEFEIIKAIAAIKYMKTADKVDLKKAIDYAIKEKQQILKDLESVFKKLPAPVARSASGAGFPNS